MAPINTGFTTRGRPTARLVRFHRRASGDGVGIALVGNVAVDEALSSNGRTAVLSARADVARLSVVARAISQTGTVPGIQLASSLPGLNPQTGWKAKDQAGEVRRLQTLVSGLPAGEIETILDAFSRSADLAQTAGFRVIQVHAAHGYLLSLLTEEAVNKRVDRFAHDSDWLEEFIARLRHRVGDSILSVRISLFSGIRSQAEEEHSHIGLARRLVQAGIDLLDCSAGLYTLDRFLIYPPRSAGIAPNLTHALRLCTEVDAAIACAGNIHDLRLLPSNLPDNLLISVGRPFIADPEFGLKSFSGDFESIRWCVRSGHCHYFSRQQLGLACGVNPNL